VRRQAASNGGDAGHGVVGSKDEWTVKFFSLVLIWWNCIRSRPDPQIFENHQSVPVLIRQGKIMYFYFPSWGKRITGAILPLAKYDWLKAK